MTEHPKFDRAKPSTKEEELICDLIGNLDATTSVFMELNHPGELTHEIFIVLRDSCIGYSGSMIRDLSECLSDSDIKNFINEARRIFNCYMDDIERKNNERT